MKLFPLLLLPLAIGTPAMAEGQFPTTPHEMTGIVPQTREVCYTEKGEEVSWFAESTDGYSFWTTDRDCVIRVPHGFF